MQNAKVLFLDYSLLTRYDTNCFDTPYFLLLATHYSKHDRGEPIKEAAVPLLQTLASYNASFASTWDF